MISDMNYVLSEEEMKELREGQGITLEEFITWEASVRDSINVRRVYVDICDDLVAGILLSQIVYWFLPTDEGNSKLTVEREGRYWLAKSRDDWWKECRITAKQFDRVSTILEDNKFIETRVFKFNGLAVKHIGLNMQMVFLRVKALFTKGKEQLISPKGNPALPQRSIPYKEAEITTKTTSEITNQPLKEDFSLVPKESIDLKRKLTKKETQDYALSFVPPARIPKVAWDAWIEMRIEKGNCPTPRAIKMAIDEMDRLVKEGSDYAAILNKSTMAGYPGLYAASNGNGKSNGNGYQNGQQPRTNGSGTSGHLLDHLPGVEDIRKRRAEDDERLRKRREAANL